MVSLSSVAHYNAGIHPLALMLPLSKYMVMPATVVKKCLFFFLNIQKYQPAGGAR